LRSIFGPKRTTLQGSGENYITTSLVICSPHQILFGRSSRRMRSTGHVVRVGERKGVYRILVGRFEGKRPLGRPGRSWENSNKMDLREVGWGHGLDWSGQDRNRWHLFVNAVMNLLFP